MKALHSEPQRDSAQPTCHSDVVVVEHIDHSDVVVVEPIDYSDAHAVDRLWGAINR